MSKRLTCIALAVGTVGLSVLSYAQTTGTGVLKLPQEIEFKGPLTGPPQTIVLYGDPTKPGLFVSRVKFSAGWKDPPHWHPDEVRTVVVLSGTFYFGSGEKWDEAKLKAYPTGTFYSEPPKAPHFTWAKDGEVIIQSPESDLRERRSFPSNSAASYCSFAAPHESASALSRRVAATQ